MSELLFIQAYSALGIVGVGVFIWKECWKTSNALGPERWEEKENPGTVLLLAAAGFIAWLMASQILMAGLQGAEKAPTTRAFDIRDVKAGTSAQLIGLSTLIVGNLAIRKNGLKTLGLGKPWKGIAPALGASAIALPLVFATGLLTQAFWKLIHFEHPDKHEVLEVLLKSPLAERWIPIASAVIAAPLFEEMLFRGHIQTFFKRMFYTRGNESNSAWVSIMMASGAFTIVHPAWTYPPIFVLSMCMGYVYERTGNLWSTILLHMIFNGVQVTLSMAMA